jgi:hypothetical protein
MISFCASALQGYLIPGISNKPVTRELVVVWLLVTVIPLTGAACSAVLLLLAEAHLPGSLWISHALRGSVLWHLSFREWLNSATLFLLLLGSAMFLPETR